MRRALGVGVAVAAAAVFLLLTRDGGDADPAGYSLAASRGCLAQLGTVREPADDVTRSASGGGVLLQLDGNEVKIAFGEDTDEAAELANAYPLGFGLTERDVNAVLAWAEPPTGAQLEAVGGCLR